MLQWQLFLLELHQVLRDWHPTLIGDSTTDLCIVGAGYTGLWTALLAKEQNPEREQGWIRQQHDQGDQQRGTLLFSGEWTVHGIRFLMLVLLESMVYRRLSLGALPNQNS